MESIFAHIFRKKKPPTGETARAEVLGGVNNSFSAWSGDAYANDVYRAAVDSIARNAAKLKGSHVIRYHDRARSEGDRRINRLLQIEPNPYMSAYDLFYKLVTRLFLYNDTFAYLQRDSRGNLAGIFPLTPTRVDFLSDDSGALVCHFTFTGGKEVYLPYTDVVHLRRNFNDNDLLGDKNTALFPALQLAHTQNEGILHAIKSSANIRGILKTNVLTSVESLKAFQKEFIDNFLNVSNNGGVLPIDAKAEYIPIDNKPYAIDASQLEAVKKKIYDYLGTNEAIVSSSYTEDQWAAFYESTIEPVALQMGLEFTRKIFNERERAFGNFVIFESGRLQFSSNATKTSMIKELMPYGMFTLNEARDIFNLAGLPDGDMRFQTLNVVAADIARKYQMSKTGADMAQSLIAAKNQAANNEERGDNT